MEKIEFLFIMYNVKKITVWKEYMDLMFQTNTARRRHK